MGLTLIPGLGAKGITKLIDHFGDAKKVWEADYLDLKSVGIRKDVVEKIIINKNKINLELEVEKVLKYNLNVLTYNNFPKLLQEIHNPPLLLYTKGNLELLQGFKLAVVGTRKITGYGIGVLNKIIPSLVGANVVIVSGLARGTDGKAHKLCLENEGKTIAVLGSSIDIIYPKEHNDLANNIQEKGLLISEFPPGTRPKKHHFPLRNRIISGLSKGVVVIEAPKKSGAIITAQLALEDNRDVFSVPGNITNPYSEGCNMLISEGAKLVTCTEDILNEY
ncbi:DNA-processing protein DprA [Natranaerobius trueperi]|uniref:DNA-protecting protein DprA n=1 Tax=Natranaerobius trueperi TaxID=759412 RepID=A0A226BZ58_9FIRM|nr:DNA-processing protein DprA [Natranaerobius trueperi]OWZ84215.1 DNA-protecting protein DprA [Natranaerobius trueperi]